jgi:template-activating factor I
MVKGGTKRGSPGAEDEKNPLQDVELSDEDAKKLQGVQREIAADFCSVLERAAQAKLVPAYEKRRQITQTIPKFWPVALLNHTLFAYHVQHSADQLALSFLEDVWVARDPIEPRCYTIEFVCINHERSWTLVEMSLLSVFRFIRPLQKTRTLPTGF